jgi:hypothetical protein
MQFHGTHEQLKLMRALAAAQIYNQTTVFLSIPCCSQQTTHIGSLILDFNKDGGF